jgi:3-isopropylmalate dehydrogenase
MTPYEIGVIGGDGIGPEVVGEALLVARESGVELKEIPFELGAAHYVATGEVLSDEVLSRLAETDAILLGAVGPPIGSKEVPPGVLERGLLLRLRFELDLYVNLRPFKGVPGSVQPEADFVVVRENTEGPYAGEGGILRKGTPFEVATQGSVNTFHGVERCVRFAFEQARLRGRKKVTLVHKTNVLTYAGDLWQRTFEAVAKEFPEVECSYNHVDACCIYMVERATDYEVIVTDNLFGDIITDLAGAVTGGIGFAASGNLNPARTGPSLFEPVHGAAHDLVGTGKANPLAAIKSVAMMLDFLGEHARATAISRAVDQVSQEYKPSMTTREVTEAVIKAI